MNVVPAPGAAVTVSVGQDAGAVQLRVANGPSAARPERPSGGTCGMPAPRAIVDRPVNQLS